MHAAELDALCFNRLRPDDAPRAYVRARDAAHVARTLGAAAREGRTVGVRSGGHHWSQPGLVAGGAAVDVLLDVGGLARIELDVAASRARVGPGVDNRALAAALAPHGLAFPYGHCGDVALGGYVLGGGMGWNQNRWGAACARVLGAEVVTPVGDVLRVDAERAPAWFDAVRGGGPLFAGAVTAYELALCPGPRAMWKSVARYPLAHLAEIVGALRAGAAAWPAWLEVVVSIGHDAHGAACTVLGTAFAEGGRHGVPDGETQARDALAVLSALLPRPLEHAVFSVAWPGLFDGVDAQFPAAHRYAADTHWLRDGEEVEVADLLARAYAAAPSPRSHALLAFGQRAERVGVYAQPGGTYLLCYGIWERAADDVVNRAWFTRLVDALGPHANGHYVGEADLARPGRLRACYDDVAWEALAALRAS